MKRKLLRVPLIVTALAAMLTVGAFAADEHSHCVCGGENTVGDHTEHQAVEWTAWEKNDQLPTEDGYYYLTTDVNLNEKWLVKNNIALCLNGHSVTETVALEPTITYNGIFDINGGTLTLTDCSNEAGSIQSADGIANPGIAIKKDGTMVMYNGSFRNPTDTGWLPSGESVGSAVSMSHGTFIMNGGSIFGCTSTTDNSALEIYKSQFIMNGGQILDGVNASDNIVNLSSSSFTMNGGTISGNSGSKNRDGIQIDSYSSFTMSGGTISNVDTGIDIGGGNDVVENGVVVTKNGEFTMNGGTIRSCAKDGVSGRGTFTMNNGTIDSCAKYGVNVVNTFTMNNGTIKNCDTGIAVDGNTTIKGGLIENCSNTGINVWPFGTLAIDGGTIQNCGKCGIELYGHLKISGSPVISKNYNEKMQVRSILFYSPYAITVSGPIGDDASIGLYTDGGYSNAVIMGSDDYKLTSSDLQKFHSENLELALTSKTTNGNLEGLLAERPSIEFSDVTNDENSKWYYNSVDWATRNGITNGTSETTFSPDLGCTRAQLVTFLWRAAGEPHAKSAENPFTDVSADQYYYEAVLWAVEKGITDGMTKTTFEPDRTCSRGQIVTFLWRAAGKPAYKSTSCPFTDVEAGLYYHDAVLWAVEQDITRGMTETTYEPDLTCTRAQGVTFLYRASSFLQ